MFNIWVDYPSYLEELAIVRATTEDKEVIVNQVLNAEQIISYQNLIRKVPVTDNVLEYAVQLVFNMFYYSYSIICKHYNINRHTHVNTY